MLHMLTILNSFQMIKHKMKS